MFDGIMNNAKGSLNMVVMFFVAGVVASVLYHLVGGGGFDFEAILKFGVTAAVAGFATSLVMGAAKG